MSSFDLVDHSDVRTIAVRDRHTGYHQIKQRASFRTVIRMLGHHTSVCENEGSEIGTPKTSIRERSRLLDLSQDRGVKKVKTSGRRITQPERRIAQQTCIETSSTLSPEVLA